MSQQNQALNTFNGLPLWAKGIIAVGVTTVVIYSGYKVFKYIEKREDDKTNREVANKADDELKKIIKDGGKLTFTEPSYSATANAIQKLLDGCETQFSEMQVTQEITKVVKNKADWYKLVSVFGNRDIKDCISGDTNNYDLISLLKDQLSLLASIPLSKYLATGGITI